MVRSSSSGDTRITRCGGAFVVCLCMLGLATLPVYAQDQDGDHGFHPHHVAVSVGGMTPLSETAQTSFAVGADYELRLDPTWGMGLGADFTFGDHKRTALFGAGATWRPTSAFRLLTGPGLELVEKDKEGGGTKTTAFFVWGFGAAYEVHVGRLSLTPTVYLDFVGETKTNLTYVIAIGTGF